MKIVAQLKDKTNFSLNTKTLTVAVILILLFSSSLLIPLPVKAQDEPHGSVGNGYEGPFFLNLEK